MLRLKPLPGTPKPWGCRHLHIHPHAHPPELAIIYPPPYLSICLHSHPLIPSPLCPPACQSSIFPPSIHLLPCFHPPSLQSSVHPPADPASIYPPIRHPSVHLYLCTHASIHPSTHPCIPFRSFRPSTLLSTHPSVHPGTHLFVGASTHPPSGCPRRMRGCTWNQSFPKAAGALDMEP